MTHVNSCITGPANVLKEAGRVRIMYGRSRGKMGPHRPVGSVCCWKCNRLLMTPNKDGQVAGLMKCPRPQCNALNEV